MVLVDKSVMKLFYDFIIVLDAVNSNERRLLNAEHRCSEHNMDDACDIVPDLLKLKQRLVLEREKAYKDIKDYLGL